MSNLLGTTPDMDITDHQMDYKYIDECNDRKILEKILRRLRSGKDGLYPHLIEHCENKVRTLFPTSKVLRKDQPIIRPRDLDPDQQEKICNSFEQWQEQMTAVDKNLSQSCDSDILTNQMTNHDDSKLPPVRSAHLIKGNKKTVVVNEEKKNSKKIKSYDYKAWDKFDVEAECTKVDEETDDIKTSTEGKRQLNIPLEVDSSGLSDSEKEIRASHEKNKGNEAFKAGDTEEAVIYYSHSISLIPTPACYNNRALAYLKLEKWKEAIEDCDIVLSSENEQGNIKAKLRRATANKALGELDRARADLSFVIEKEPNNARAKSILKEVEQLEKKQKTKKKEITKTKRKEITKTKKTEIPTKSGRSMQIDEVDGESSDDDEEADDDQKSVLVNGTKKPNEDSLSAEENPENPSAVTDSNSATPENVNRNQTSEQEIEEPTLVPVFPPDVLNLKNKGAELFKTGQYAEASGYYTKAIERMIKYNIDFKPLEGQSHDLAFAVLHNNRAACWLKQGNDKACVEDCTKVLNVKSWDVKALMRRAVAYEHMEKFVQAFVDFKAAESIEWNNPFAQSGSNRAANNLRQIHGAKWREKLPHVPVYAHRKNVFQNGAVPKETGSEEEKIPSGTENGEIKNQSEFPVNSDSPKEKIASTETVPKPEPKKVLKRDQVKESVGKVTSVDQVTAKESGSGDKVNAADPKFGKSSVKVNANVKKSKNNKKTNKKIKQEAKKKEELEVEAKKEKIRKELYEKLKSQGNENVKKGAYAEAIECYTRCITMCPKEPASYTNRALCFLKLEKNVSAANDCTEAIKLDPVNVKAFYRRSQARKGEKMYKEASRDIAKLLTIDPGNKTAKDEMEVLRKLINGKSTTQTEPPLQTENKRDDNRPAEASSNQGSKLPKKKIVIEEVSDSSEDEEEVQEKTETQNNQKLPVDEEVINMDLPPNMKIPDKEVTDSIVTDSHQTQKPEEQKIKDIPKPQPIKEKYQNQPTVETQTPALTPFEFGNRWNAVPDKTNVLAYKAILDQSEPRDLPLLISNKIDDTMIIIIAKIAALNIGQGEVNRGYDLMVNLSKSKRFSMATMFLSSDDRKILCETFEKLTDEVNEHLTKNDVKSLMKLYNL